MTVQIAEVGNLIGGREDFDGERVEIRNPGLRTEVVGAIRAASAGAVGRAVEAAAAAQPGWAATSIDERIAVCERIAVRIESHANDLGELLARESGVPLADARGEAFGSAFLFRNAIALADALRPAPDVVAAVGGGRIRVTKRPLGVVAGLVPWNAPLGLAAQKLGPALLAGNGFVLKPSPLAPLALTRLAMLVAAELPAGLLGVVNGGGDVGAALIEHPLVRKVSFTGGGATARSIMRAAAGSLTKVHFELGGNDPAILLDDADLDVAAQRVAASAFRRSGQVCYAIKRVYVPEAQAAPFTERLSAVVGELVVGDALDPRTTMGPLNNAQQFEYVRGLAERAHEAGRRVSRLGEKLDAAAWGEGHFLRPMVVPDAVHADELVAVEQFGPILPVVAYSSLDEAVAWANDSDYGLGSSVWSADEERALAVADRIEAGVTFVNDHVLSLAALRHVPFGGIKQSGMGWENSVAGIDEYLEFHSVDVHPLPPVEAPAGG